MYWAECFPPHAAQGDDATAAGGSDTKGRSQLQRKSKRVPVQQTQHCNTLENTIRVIKENHTMLRTWTLPSHIALSCCGVLPVGGAAVADGLFPSRNKGLAFVPTLLGILAEPSVIAEKLTPMKRRIISWVTWGASKGAIWEALKSWVSCLNLAILVKQRYKPWRMWDSCLKPTSRQGYCSHSKTGFQRSIRNLRIWTASRANNRGTYTETGFAVPCQWLHHGFKTHIVTDQVLVASKNQNRYFPEKSR